MQRLPANDNASFGIAPGQLGVFGSVWSGLGFCAILIVGSIVLLLFRLVPASEESDYLPGLARVLAFHNSVTVQQRCPRRRLAGSFYVSLI